MSEPTIPSETPFTPGQALILKMLDWAPATMLIVGSNGARYELQSTLIAKLIKVRDVVITHAARELTTPFDLAVLCLELAAAAAVEAHKLGLPMNAAAFADNARDFYESLADRSASPPTAATS